MGPDLVAVTGRGDSLPDAFAQAALGVLGLIAGPPRPGPADAREVRAHGQSLDSLLAAWIGECLYVHEIEGFVPDRIDFAAFATGPAAGAEALRLHAFVHGGEADPGEARPDAPRVVRGATVREDIQGFEARVTLGREPA